MPLFLHVTSIPPGEAPLWVRQEWVGLTLPLKQRDSRPMTLHTSGVVTGPRSFGPALLALLLGRYEKQSGYVVDAQSAVDVLARSSPQAAAWWRDNTPHLLKPHRFLVFQKEVGHVSDASA